MATQLLSRPREDARIMTEAVLRIGEFWGLTKPARRPVRTRIAGLASRIGSAVRG